MPPRLHLNLRHLPLRRLSLRLVLIALLSVGVVLSSAAQPAGADDTSHETPSDGELRGEAPPGATDGQPTGTWDDPPQSTEDTNDTGGGDATSSASDGEATTSATTRHFGKEPFEIIKATAEAIDPPCAISNRGLTALMIAPVFKEVSMATAKGAEPSPMTLSRFDEWSGTKPPPDTNSNTNYGLYAFENPNTPFARAFWHPGIGIWQYDSAGVGAPFTAAQRVDVSGVAGDVGKNMAIRYCNASGDDQAKRYAAWAPWGHPCTLCETTFDEMYSTNFGNLVLNPDVTAKGGMQTRTCRIRGTASSFTCHYIDPAKAQGANWWTASPSGGEPASGMTPLSAPFYVFARDGHEERHWLARDTGYSVSISARREIGKNARPRLNPAGSGLQWYSGSLLCDLSVSKSDCMTNDTTVTVTGVTDRGSAIPLRGDFNGGGVDDLFWYAAGGAPDDRWISSGNGSFTKRSMPVSGSYLPFVGDFDGDGRDDIFWYAPGSAPDFIWWSGDNSQSVGVTVNGAYRPIVGDFDGNGSDDVFWYAPGGNPDHLWKWSSSRKHSSKQTQVLGNYTTLAGDFDGDGKTDIFWYRPGSGADSIWYGTANGFVGGSANVNGTYVPLVGDFDDDGRDDIFWYASGPARDYTWFGRTTRSSWVNVRNDVHGAYKPFVVDLNLSSTPGGDDIVWYAPGQAADFRWHGRTDRRFSSSDDIYAGGSFRPIPGQFAGSDRGDILWWDPTGSDDRLWFS